MITLALRTDKPEAELYIYDDHEKLTGIKWRAHLKLAETLNHKIEELLNKSSIDYEDIQGLVVFKGPGSFTGLRIGISVANTLAYARDIPIVATPGKDWIEKGLRLLDKGEGDGAATPEYGGAAHITKPRK